jgi:hypothetical protein
MLQLRVWPVQRMCRRGKLYWGGDENNSNVKNADMEWVGPEPNLQRMRSKVHVRKLSGEVLL